MPSGEHRHQDDGMGGAQGEDLEQFIASVAQAPSELVLDFDATNDRVHGCQEARFFHGYYDAYCFCRCRYFALSCW